MNYMFELQERYLTSERSERVRYWSCHEDRTYVDLDDFPKNSDHFPKISEDSPKLVRRSHERYWAFSENIRKLPKISEDYRRLPKTFEEDPKMFWWYTKEFKNNLRDKLISVKSSISSCTSENMENTQLESQMWFRMNFTSGVFSSKTRVSM